MSYDTLRYEVDDGVAVITLARPERLNAWTPEMGTELAAACARAARERAVRAIVLTGAGRGFCAGMDHANLERTQENRARVRRTDFDGDVPRAAARTDFTGLFNYFPTLAKPVIAAINGPAAGSGLVLALACDVRFADENAVLTSAFARRGLVAEHGIAWLLARVAGLPAALDLLLSGRRVAAAEAKQMGLVNFVAPAGMALQHAIAYARELATQCSPSAMAVIKRQVWQTPFETLFEATCAADKAMLESFDGADFAEAQAAHAQGRAPAFAPI